MSRFTLYPLFTRVRLVTNGNLFSSPIYVDIDLPDLVDLSPVEELTLLSLQEGGTTLFRWNVYFGSGVTRQTELAGGPFPIGATVAANGSLRHAPYNTLTNMLNTSRFMIGFGNSTGTANESALCTAYLGVKKVGQ